MMGRSRRDKFRIVTNALTNWRWCDVQNLMMINNIDWPEWSSQTSIRLITKYIILPKISNHQRVDNFYLSFQIFWDLKRVKWKSWLKYPKIIFYTSDNSRPDCQLYPIWWLKTDLRSDKICNNSLTDHRTSPLPSLQIKEGYEFNFEIQDRERSLCILHNLEIW